MHSYKIITLDTGFFDESTVRIVQRILKDGLKKDDKWEAFRNYVKSNLLKEIGDYLMCAVDMMGRSYFINVYACGKKNILIGVKYLEMETLRDLAACKVAKHLGVKSDIHHLEIPPSLHGYIRNFQDDKETKFGRFQRAIELSKYWVV